jgi:hypothetical protein
VWPTNRQRFIRTRRPFTRRPSTGSSQSTRFAALACTLGAHCLIASLSYFTHAFLPRCLQTHPRSSLWHEPSPLRQAAEKKAYDGAVKDSHTAIHKALTEADDKLDNQEVLHPLTTKGTEAVKANKAYMTLQQPAMAALKKQALSEVSPLPEPCMLPAGV